MQGETSLKVEHQDWPEQATINAAAIRFYLYLNIMKVITLLTILALVFAANCWTLQGHEMKGDASKGVYDGIKDQLLNTILTTLTNKDTANALRADLTQTDAKKMTFSAIDVASVAQIFTAFGVKTPDCDTDKNGKVEKDELKCLGKLWKYYVPKNK